MTDMIMITWTCGGIDEARKVGRYLVQEGLVACVSIIPWVESIYMWSGKLDTAQETKVLLKTRRHCFDKVKEIILENARYDVPEITFVEIAGVSESYLAWLNEAVDAPAPA